MPISDVRRRGARLAGMVRNTDEGTLLGVLCVSAEVESIRDARAFVRQTLDVQAVTVTVVDDAVLIASELLTNAMLHGGDGGESEAMVRIIVTEKHLRIEVHDASPVGPVERTANDGAEDGRGLAVVGALADRWGWEPTAGGKFVWCELAAWPEQTATDRA